MNKKIFLSVLVILAVIVITATATYAYFSNTKDEYASVGTARIEIGSTWNFPLAASNLLPGEEVYQDVSIYNNSTRAADLFFQMIGYDDGTNTNYCFDFTPGPVVDRVLDIAVYDLDTSTWWSSWTSICDLYPGQASSWIMQIGNDVPAGSWKNLRVYLRLAATAGNDEANGFNQDIVHLIAVQFNGPAPQPDKQGFATMVPWPGEDDGIDDDPNYP